MNKLTTNHLATYLPYDLNFKELKTDDYLKMIALNANGLITLKRENGSLATQLLDVSTLDFLPLLIPLSDLPKDKKFLDFAQDQSLMTLDFAYNDELDIFSIRNMSFIPVNITQQNEIAEECPFIFYEYLIENHYDIFGLIGLDLAIKKTGE
jgi:hypothetical protein